MIFGFDTGSDSIKANELRQSPIQLAGQRSELRQQIPYSFLGKGRTNKVAVQKGAFPRRSASGG